MFISSPESCENFETPKSRILMKSRMPAFDLRRKTLSGLRSRWMIPAACAAPRASRICDMTGIVCSGTIGPVRWMRDPSVSPSRYSITM